MTWLDPFTRLWSGTPQTARSSRRPRLSLEELQQRYVPAMLIPSSLSGYVYCETCTCGAVNPSEAPINGVTITLTGTDSTNGASVSMTATTNSAGLYSFQNLDPGTYTLTEIVPTGYTADKTTQGTPGNGTVSPGVIADISLASGVDGTNNDFGDICPTVPPPPPPPPPTGSLCGTVFSYCNGMSGDTGIQGVTITLSGPGGTRTATTDSSGHYAFTDLVAGTYTITETPPTGYTQGTTTAGTPTDGVANGDMISNISVHGTALTGYNFGEISPDCGRDHKPPTCDHDKDCGDDKDHHSPCDNDDHDKDHSCDNGDHDKDHQGGCGSGDHDKDHSTCDNDDHDKDHVTCGSGDHDKDHSTCGDGDKDHSTCDNGDHDKDHSACGNGDHDKDHSNCGGGDGDKDHSTCGNDHDKDHVTCGSGNHDKDHSACDNDKDSHFVCDNDKDHRPSCDTGDHDKDHSACDTGDHDKGHSNCDNGKDNFTTCDNGDHSQDNRGSTCDQVKSLHC